MKNKFKFKKFLKIFLINLIIFIILYMNMIYPIKRNYDYNSPILDYNVKTDISNLSIKLNNVFNDIGLNNILSYFDNEVSISASAYHRRNRAGAYISLKAKYENDTQKETIVTELKSLNLKEQFSNDRIHIKYNNSTTISLGIYNKGPIYLEFYTRLPYNAIKDSLEEDPFVDFHLELNKMIRNIVKEQLKYNYIIILAILITMNLILHYIIYVLKQVISKA